jgi:uncharacterized membrane protein
MTYLVLATFFSGLTFFFVKIITTKIYPILGNLLSLSSALVIQLLIFFYLRYRGTNMNVSQEGVAISLVAGIFVALYTVFLFLAFSKVDVSKGTPILYIGSLVIATILSVIFLKESLNIYNIVGLLLAGASIFLILWK